MPSVTLIYATYGMPSTCTYQQALCGITTLLEKRLSNARSSIGMHAAPDRMVVLFPGSRIAVQ